MIFRKIIAVIGAVLTFILLLYLLGFVVSTFFPNYENNFFISLILIFLFSFIVRKVYSLIRNYSTDNNESNLKLTNNELNSYEKSDEDYEYLNIRVKKPKFIFKCENENVDIEIDDIDEKS